MEENPLSPMEYLFLFSYTVCRSDVKTHSFGHFSTETSVMRAEIKVWSIWNRHLIEGTEMSHTSRPIAAE